MEGSSAIPRSNCFLPEPLLDQGCKCDGIIIFTTLVAVAAIGVLIGGILGYLATEYPDIEALEFFRSIGAMESQWMMGAGGATFALAVVGLICIEREEPEVIRTFTTDVEGRPLKKGCGRYYNRYIPEEKLQTEGICYTQADLPYFFAAPELTRGAHHRDTNYSVSVARLPWDAKFDAPFENIRLNVFTQLGVNELPTSLDRAYPGNANKQHVLAIHQVCVTVNNREIPQPELFRKELMLFFMPDDQLLKLTADQMKNFCAEEFQILHLRVSALLETRLYSVNNTTILDEFTLDVTLEQLLGQHLSSKALSEIPKGPLLSLISRSETLNQLLSNDSAGTLPLHFVFPLSDAIPGRHSSQKYSTMLRLSTISCETNHKYIARLPKELFKCLSIRQFNDPYFPWKEIVMDKSKLETLFDITSEQEKVLTEDLLQNLQDRALETLFSYPSSICDNDQLRDLLRTSQRLHLSTEESEGRLSRFPPGTSAPLP